MLSQPTAKKKSHSGVNLSLAVDEVFGFSGVIFFVVACLFCFIAYVNCKLENNHCVFSGWL